MTREDALIQIADTMLHRGKIAEDKETLFYIINELAMLQHVHEKDKEFTEITK